MTMGQLLHLGMSGIPFAGSDVGGYSGREESTPELFSRWMSLGAISPFFRAHAEKDARRQEPWAFGDETLEATRALIRFRYGLMPYIYSVFDESALTCAPVLRPLVFEFQEDPATHAVADEAMLGPSLLVAPLMDAQPTRAVLLPKGRWYELHSGAFFEGGQTVTLAATPDPLPKDALPVFAREGAIIPRTEPGTNVAASHDGTLVLDAFPGKVKSAFTLREDEGTTDPALSRITFTTVRTDAGVRFEASAPAGTYVAAHRAVLVRIRRVDHDVTSVKQGGAPLPRAASVAALTPGSFAWDANDRTLVVALPTKFPFDLDIAFDPKVEANGDVDIPLEVKLPPGTPEGTAIHVASSRAGWVHLPLARTGDVARGLMRAPRGGYTSFKITRGDWPTVEKSGACAEIKNRSALGAGEPLTITVAAWADRCP
jgi:alpha-glucosidase